MAKNTTWSTVERNTKLDAVKADFNTGYLRIYDSTGTGQPAGPDTAITTQVLLAELRFNATAFPASSSGVLTANAITSDAAANATGTATWFRCLKSDGTTALMDGTVGTASANLILATTSIVINAVVDVSSFTITDAAASAL
jgi:hypothetical protein